MEYKSQQEWQFDAKQLSKLPGLFNQGWNCYANAMLQVLIHTPPVFNHFQKHSCRCGNNCVYCVMKETFFSPDKTGTSRRERTNPIQFLTQIINNNQLDFKLGQRGDPLEFYKLLEVKMEESEKDFLKDIFSCHQTEIRRCKACNNKIEHEGKYPFLYVAISNGNIAESLTKYFVERYYKSKKRCSDCGTAGKVTERKITKPPPVLRVQPENLCIFKTSRTKINFTETLDISSYLAVKNGKPVIYELSSVIVYTDVAGGHYYSYCKAPSGQWNKYDDNRVHPVDLNTVLDEKPYSLFYIKTPCLDENVMAEKENKQKKMLKRNVEIGTTNEGLRLKLKLGRENNTSSEKVGRINSVSVNRTKKIKRPSGYNRQKGKYRNSNYY